MLLSHCIVMTLCIGHGLGEFQIWVFCVFLI